jgi:hypothetical protein
VKKTIIYFLLIIMVLPMISRCQENDERVWSVTAVFLERSSNILCGSVNYLNCFNINESECKNILTSNADSCRVEAKNLIERYINLPLEEIPENPRDVNVDQVRDCFNGRLVEELKLDSVKVEQCLNQPSN